MPTYIKATAVPESLLKLEPVLKELVVAYTTMNNARFTDHLKEIDERSEEMFAELHEALDLQPTLDMGRIVSIQVQTTRLTGAGVELVAFKDQHIKPTHWSIYKRDAAGMAHWIEDIDLRGAQADVVFGQAMTKAAKYSQIYSAFIEQVK